MTPYWVVVVPNDPIFEPPIEGSPTCFSPSKFSCWHLFKEGAVAEAERLCRKEQKPVYLLKVEGIASMKNPPIEWEGVKG